MKVIALCILCALMILYKIITRAALFSIALLVLVFALTGLYDLIIQPLKELITDGERKIA